MNKQDIQKAYDSIYPTLHQRERMLQNIRSKEENRMKPFEFTSKPEPNHVRKWVPAAAAVVLVCCAGAFVAFRPGGSTVDPVETRWETVPLETVEDLQTEPNVPAAPEDFTSNQTHVCTTDPCDDDYHHNEQREDHHEDHHH